jgi:hypothetical protein
MRTLPGRLAAWLRGWWQTRRCNSCQRMIDLSNQRGDRAAALRWQRRLEQVAGWDELPKDKPQ